MKPSTDKRLSSRKVNLDTSASRKVELRHAKPQKLAGKVAANKPSRTQEERRADAEQKLIAAALQMVAEKGLSRTTLSDVGERAGFSRGLPAHHYGNKEGLLTGMITHVRERFVGFAQGQLDGATGLDSVLKYVETYLTDQRSIAVRAWLIIQSEALLLETPLLDQITSHNKIAAGMLQKRLARGIDDGSIRSDIDPRRYSVILIGLLRGIVAQSLMEGKKVAPEKILEDAGDLVRRAISAKP